MDPSVAAKGKKKTSPSTKKEERKPVSSPITKAAVGGKRGAPLSRAIAGRTEKKDEWGDHYLSFIGDGGRKGTPYPIRDVTRERKKDPLSISL